MGKIQALKDEVGDLQETLTAKNQEIARLNILVTKVQGERDKLAEALDDIKTKLENHLAKDKES